MKTRLLSLLAATTLPLLVAGCTSLPQDHASRSEQVKLSTATIYSGEDEQILQLHIETEKTEYFRIQGEHFSMHGNTAPSAAGKTKRCTASVWLIGTSITYEGHTHTRLRMQAGGGTLTLTYEYPKETQLTNILHLKLPGSPMTHPLNRDLNIGTWNLEEMRLLVGPAVYPSKMKQAK